MGKAPGFTEGFGTAGRLYERLRKRSIRNIGKRAIRIVPQRGVGEYMKAKRMWVEPDHEAYVRGLRDGIKGCLDLNNKGGLY